MRHKMFALILALTVMSWAQTATPNPPSSPGKAPPAAKCACCEKMASADAKGAPACCAHHADAKADSKEMASCCNGKDSASCCGGKDAKACMQGDKMADSCCKGKGGVKCDRKAGKECGKGCCGSNKSEKPA